MNSTIETISSKGALSADTAGKVKEATSSADKDVNAGKAQPESAAQALPSDQVNLTQTAQQVQAIERGLENVPEVDRARVNEVKQRIAEGSFQPNPEVIADKLLDIEQMLS